MPDNIPITPGLGVTVATDQDSVTGAHYQRVKLMDGTEASSDPIVSDGKGSLRVRTADEDMLKDGNASVKVANDQTQPVPVQLDRYGRSLSGNAVPVVLATDHDAVPVTSSSLPMVGGALGANGAIFGPIPLVGCNGVLVQLSGTYNLTVIFEATVLDPTTGPWVSVNGTRTNNGQIDTNPAVNSLNAAWDFFLAGFTYFRIRVTAFTSGLAQFQVARYTNAQDPTPSVVAQGAAATGTAVTGNPVLVAGSDGANARNLSTDATGRAVVAGGAAVGAAVAGNPVFVAGTDGASTGYARQPTVTPPNTAVNGQATNQPTMLLIGGVDGVYTVSPSQAAPNLNPVGTARALLTDNAGVLQVSDSSIGLLRQELRETNALLLMILQALAGNDMVTGKDVEASRQLTTTRRSELSGLGLDTFGQPLTDSWFPGGDGENGPPRTATGAHIWPAMANTETNGERENARNVGQLRTSGNGYAVNELRARRWRERNWLPDCNPLHNMRLENCKGSGSSAVLTAPGVFRKRELQLDIRLAKSSLNYPIEYRRTSASPGRRSQDPRRQPVDHQILALTRGILPMRSRLLLRL